MWELLPGADVLGCLEVWCAPVAWPGAQEFAEATRKALLGPAEGLPGRVLSSGEPAWIVEFATHDDFPRAQRAALAGVGSAACFPIRSPNGILGAIEFFTSRAARSRPRDARDDGQPGQPDRSARGAAARGGAGREASEHQRATCDGRARLHRHDRRPGAGVEFNPAVEQTFGYRADEAIGREMAELIVPPSLRERHRDGLAAHLETGRQLLGRADRDHRACAPTAREFPGGADDHPHRRCPGRRRSRASCATSPTASARRRSSARRAPASSPAADDARRRLERDLHDGAQQRLVASAWACAWPAVNGRAAGRDSSLTTRWRTWPRPPPSCASSPRGLHPAVLSRRRARPRAGRPRRHLELPVELLSAPDERFPPRVESAAYFLVAEALTNVARYAQATKATVSVTAADGNLLVEVRDDGRGGADPDAGLRAARARRTASPRSTATLEVVSSRPAGNPRAGEHPVRVVIGEDSLLSARASPACSTRGLRRRRPRGRLRRADRRGRGTSRTSP